MNAITDYYEYGEGFRIETSEGTFEIDIEPGTFCSEVISSDVIKYKKEECTSDSDSGSDSGTNKYIQYTSYKTTSYMEEYDNILALVFYNGDDDDDNNEVIRFTVTNSHNGYYSHDAWIKLLTEETLRTETL